MGGGGVMMMLGSKKIPVSDISADAIFIYLILSECVDQILVTNICNGGRMSDI